MTLFKHDSAIKKLIIRIESNRYASISVIVLGVALAAVTLYSIYEGYALRKLVMATMLR